MKNLIMIVVLATALAGSFAVANAGGDKPPESNRCEFYFNENIPPAPARKSCHGLIFTEPGNNQYRVSGNCNLDAGPGSKLTTITVTDARNCAVMANCNGELAVGSCGNQ